MDYQNIIVKKEEGVATITLNRPDSLNAMNDEMLKELLEAIEDVGGDEAVRVIVLTGAGRAFCPGADLKSSAFEGERPAGMKRIIDWGNIPIKLRGMPKPVITAVNGAAVGGGFGIALAGDIIIASDKARFGHAYTNIGLMSDTGLVYFLPRLIGTSKALELIFTGRIIDAEEAERLGIVNQVVPADQLEAVTKELALKLAKRPPIALGLAKISVYQGLQMDLATSIQWEGRGHLICRFSEDSKEGVQAFKEKREPQFKGR